jgi:hypothetical protein
MFHFLGSQLRENHERAYGTFGGLHDLVHSSRQRAYLAPIEQLRPMLLSREAYASPLTQSRFGGGFSL